MRQVVDGINETEDQIGAGQTDNEVVARLSQIGMPHDGPVTRTFITSTTRNVVWIRHRRSQRHLGHLSWRILIRSSSPTPRRTCKNFEKARGGVRKSGVLKHKSRNISETQKDRGKDTME